MTITPAFIERFRGISTAGDLLTLVHEARGEPARLGGHVVSTSNHGPGLEATVQRCHVCSGEIAASDEIVLEDFEGGGTPLATHASCHALRSGLTSAEIYVVVKLGFWLTMQCQHAKFKSWRPRLVETWLADRGSTVGSRVVSGVAGWGPGVQVQSDEELSLWLRRMFLVDREAPKFEHHGVPLPAWDEHMPWADYKKHVFMPAYESLGERSPRGSLRPATEVLARTGGRCALCGGHIMHGDSLRDPNGRLGLARDHIHPFSKGGADILENLQPLHRPCNGAISSIGPGEIPMALELGRWVIGQVASADVTDGPKWLGGLSSSYASYQRNNRRSRRSGKKASSE